MSLSVVILAAGQGKRMRSALPKVLHPIGDKPILAHVINAAQTLQPQNIYIIYGHGGEQVRNALAQHSVQWIEQTKQLGTGHAVLQAMPNIPDDHRVLVLLGDVPLITSDTLKKLLDQTTGNAVGLVTVQMPDPTGLGRVLRSEKNTVVGIIEDKDATPEQHRINEINTGIITAPASLLRKWLPNLSNANAQAEYYLPEIIAKAVAEDVSVEAVSAASIEEVYGINDRAQLAFLERYYQQCIARQLMLAGVTLKDPARLDVRGECDIAADVTIDVNVIFEGKVKIGAGGVIGPNCILRNVIVGNGVTIKANTIIEEAEIAAECTIGPFARIRPGTCLKEKVHVGNFVEVKNSMVGPESKINHLSYIGDATIGEAVNIGAGTITCNYDGFKKQRTQIGDRVQVGSDTTLVAPIIIEDDVYIATATTVRQDVPAGSLVFNRRTEEVRMGWTAEKIKKEKIKKEKIKK
jgi:bifunctional UDP-N-acetylglucosamine pyrophosphorylase/glucosamine-1-phosphate N-acetyltransferase